MGVQLHAQFRLANRDAIEDEIERLIALLDDLDGDTDLEDGYDCEAVNEDGEGDFGKGLLAPLPLYGIDQSAGPINYAGEEVDHRAAAAGLVRTPEGRWRPARPH